MKQLTFMYDFKIPLSFTVYRLNYNGTRVEESTDQQEAMASRLEKIMPCTG